MSTLKTRLQNPDYKNWIKAGLCLIHAKAGLEDFADRESQLLYQNILTNLTRASIATPGHPVCGITINRQKLVNTCVHPYCQCFLTAVIQEGIDPHHPFTIRPANLANTDIRQWHSHPWELAKLFMNQGQLPTQTSPSQTDLSGILNFLSHCKVPRNQVTNVLLIDEVRKARNGIMHTSDMKLSASDLKNYSQSMIDLLNDPSISSFPRAQFAVTEIQRIMNTADIHINLEDESKVMEKLAGELQKLAVEIRQKIADVAECGEVEREGIRKQLQLRRDEIGKVSCLYEILRGKVETHSDIHKTMLDQLSGLEELMEEATRDLRTLQNRLGYIERQQKRIEKQNETYQTQTTQAVGDLTTKQEAYERKTDQAIVNIKTSQETSQAKTTQAIDEIKAKQETYQRQTHQRLDDLTNMNAQKHSIPSDEDTACLQQHLKDGYQKKKLNVTLLPKWIELHVSKIFSPVILMDDKPLQSYKDMFFKDRSVQEIDKDIPNVPIFLLGKAGTGKSTLCKHLTDAWSNKTNTPPQFSDVNVLQGFEFLFYVSCRFAKEKDSFFDMIENQLFSHKDEAMRNVARYVLKHHPELCLILADGLDEWKGSSSSDTGRREDIQGVPSMDGVEDCVIVITSRPWRFLALSLDTQKQSRRLMLSGIKNESELIRYILKHLKDPEPELSRDEFLHQIRKNKMSDLLKTPLMLIVAIDIWKNDKILHKTLCMNYVNMITSFIRRTEGQGGWSTSERRLSERGNYSDIFGIAGIQLPSCFTVNKLLKRYSGLLLLLGHLAYDLMFGKQEQSLVFSKEDCELYLYDEDDETLTVCLALGILSKTETTTRGIEIVESYSFSHKTFQEFFAALWLAIKYADENSNLYQHVKTIDSVFDYSVLIQFLCGLCPQAGADFWRYVATEVIEKDEDIMEYRHGDRDYPSTLAQMQDLVLKTMKEAQDCCDQHAEEVCYCISDVVIGGNTSDENISLLCNMMENNSLYTKYLRVCNEIYNVLNLSSCQYHSIFRSVSCASDLQRLELINISCSTNSSIDCFTVLDLQKHQRLKILFLNKLSISALLLPGQKESQLRELKLWDLALSHDNLVQLCRSLSSLAGLEKLDLTNLSCSDHSGRFCLHVLGLLKHRELSELDIDRLPISGLLLPSQESLLRCLVLKNLVLSHDSLVQLCRSLSSLAGLEKLKLIDLSCRSCRCLPVLDLQEHHKLGRLVMETMSVEGLLPPVKMLSLFPIKDYYLNRVNMSAPSWRRFIEGIAHSSSDRTVAVTLYSCHIESDTRDFISSCPQFSVERIDENVVKFDKIQLETDSDSSHYYYYYYPGDDIDSDSYDYSSNSTDSTDDQDSDRN